MALAGEGSGNTGEEGSKGRRGSGLLPREAKASARAHAATGEAEAGLNHVWENERHYLGFGWWPPTILERSNFTDALCVAVPPPRSVTSGGDWAVHVDSSTDLDGWQYASGFEKFSKMRSGGRASMRLTDGVRRRKWVKVSELDAALGRLAHMEAELDRSGASSGSGRWLQRGASTSSRTVVTDSSLRASPHTNALATLGGSLLQRTDKAMRAIKGFMQLLHSTLKERGLWGMPLDPASYAVLLNRHAEDVRELQRKTLDTFRRSDGSGLSLEGNQDDAEEPRLLMKEAALGSPEINHLVEMMMSASLYARAAYGYPLVAGYLTSMNSALFMGTLKTVQFDVAGGASADAHNKALLQETHLRECDLLMSEWKNSVCRPCHYVAVDPSRQTIVIGIRGSLQPADVLTDSMADSLEVSFAGVTGKVHEGIFAAATFVHCNTAEVLKAAVEKYPSWPLIVTGHSLGGGVAAVLTMLLREPNGCPESLRERVSCVALGCPAVMTTNLSDACRSYVTSLVLRHDFVARLSAASIDLLLQELVSASPIRNFSEKVGGFFRSLSRRDSSATTPAAPSSSLSSFPRLAVECDESAENAASLASRALSEDGSAVPSSTTPAYLAGKWGAERDKVNDDELLRSLREEPDIPGVDAGVEFDNAEPSGDTEGKQGEEESDGGRCEGVVLGSHREAIRAAVPVHSRSAPALGCTSGEVGRRIGSDSACGGDSFSDHGIRASDGLPARNQCPHGTGGDTKFDLLFPAGRVLWVVERGESGSSRGQPRSRSDSSVAVDAAATSSTKNAENVFEMMEQAWASMTVGGDSSQAAQPRKKPSDMSGSGTVEPAVVPGDFQLSEYDSEEEEEPEDFGARAKPFHGTPLARLKWTPTFVECPPHTFGRLHLNSEMLNDHLPDYYSDAIKKLYRWYVGGFMQRESSAKGGNEEAHL